MWVGCHLSKTGRGGMACLDGGCSEEDKVVSLPHTSVGGKDLSHGGGYFGSPCVTGFFVHPTSCQWVRGA